MLIPVKFILTSMSTSNPAPEEKMGFVGMKGFWTCAGWIRCVESEGGGGGGAVDPDVGVELEEVGVSEEEGGMLIGG